MESTSAKIQETTTKSDEPVVDRRNWLDVDQFDVILVGTGMIEAVAAAALSRAGKRILHLDRNDFYGSNSASFPLEPFDEFMQSTSPDLPVSNVKVGYKEADFEELKKHNRMSFSLELIPKSLLAESEELHLLIQSGISRYLEFKLIDASFMYAENAFQLVPCSNSDVYKTKFLALLEKRQLKRFLSSIEEESQKQELNGSFLDWIKPQINDKLQKFVLYSILFQTAESAPKLSKRDGIAQLRLYMSSIGKYGPSPWLQGLYGAACETIQAYCRHAAVFGAMYILRRFPRSFDFDGDVFHGIVDSEGQKLTANHLVTSPSYLPQFCKPSLKQLSRCICISREPLIDHTFESDEESKRDHQVLAVIPPMALENPSPIFIFQFGAELKVAPKDAYVIHFVTESSLDRTAEQDLKKAVTHLMQITEGIEPKPADPIPSSPSNVPSDSSTTSEASTTSDSKDATDSQDASNSKKDEESDKKIPRALYSAFFNLKIEEGRRDGLPKNVFVTCDPNSEMDNRSAIAEARRIFEEICPEEVFLPNTPSPEDIIWEQEDEGDTVPRTISAESETKDSEPQTDDKIETVE